jgi:hypothetical protein
MKYMYSVILALTMCIAPAYAAGEIKEVCHDKKEASGKIVTNKDGTPVQVCKKIKVHKKLEGTTVPTKK